MDTLRSFIASLLLIVFVPIALGAALIWGVMNAATIEVAKEGLAAARVSERLPPLLAGPLAALVVGGAKLKLTLPPKLIADAWTPAIVGTTLDRLAEETLGYVRGEKSQMIPVDPAPLLTGLDVALKKNFPGLVGRQIAAAVQKELTAQGWDKGLIVPPSVLDQARTGYAALRLAGEVTLGALLLFWVLILAVTPNGWRSRLKFGGLALLLAGLLVAALGAVIPSGINFVAASFSNIPVEAKTMLQDFLASAAKALSLKLYLAAGVYGGAGIICFVIRAILGKKTAEPPPAEA